MYTFSFTHEDLRFGVRPAAIRERSVIEVSTTKGRFLGAYELKPRAAGGLEISGIVTLPSEYRRRGIAKTMRALALREAKRRGERLFGPLVRSEFSEAVTLRHPDCVRCAQENTGKVPNYTAFAWMRETTEAQRQAFIDAGGPRPEVSEDGSYAFWPCLQYEILRAPEGAYLPPER